MGVTTSAVGWRAIRPNARVTRDMGAMRADGDSGSKYGGRGRDRTVPVSRRALGLVLAAALGHLLLPACGGSSEEPGHTFPGTRQDETGRFRQGSSI